MRNLASVLALVTAGCGIANFDVGQPVPEQMVSGSGIPGPLAALFPIPVSLDIGEKIKQQDTGPINSISITSLELTITATDVTAGDTDDWSFLTQCDVFVSSTASGSTLPKVKIATIGAPGAVQTATFTVDETVNLKDYVNEGSMTDSMCSGTAPADAVSYAGSANFSIHPL